MKRFTETQKWEDPWFRRLRPEIKLLWQWILDRCDNAGVIDPDVELASFQIGYQYPMDTLSEFGERVVKLPCGKWFIPKFIAFQYGTLSAECKAHKPIFLSLQKHSIELALNGYPKGINTLQEKEKEKDTETVLQSSLNGVEPNGNQMVLAGGETKPLCTLEQALSYAPTARLTPEQATFWWHTRNASGWTKGTQGGGAGRKITSFQSDMQTSAAWIAEAMSKHNTPNGTPRPRNMDINGDDVKLPPPVDLDAMLKAKKTIP